MHLGPFRNKAFLSLWITALISTFSLSVAWVVESWYAINVLHREKEFGYILLCSMVPRILFMLVGGAVADAFSKRNVIAASLTLRAMLLIGLGLAIAAGVAGFALILLVAFLYGVIDAYYWPSRDAVLVEVLPHDDLPRANSVMLTTGQVGWIVGPALGGMLVGMFPLGAILTALGLTVLAASLTFLLLFPARDVPAHRVDAPVSRLERASRFLAELKAGLVYVRRHPQFSVLMTLFAVANILFMGPLQQSVPLIATHDLGADAGSFGNMWAAWGAGMACGGLLMSLLAPARKRFLIVIYMLLAESVLLGALAYAGNLLAACAILFVIGVCVACNNVPTMSMLQIYSDRDKVGRVMGLNDTISMGFTPLSYVGVSALLVAGVDHGTILTCAGAVMFAFCLFMFARYPVIRTTD